MNNSITVLMYLIISYVQTHLLMLKSQKKIILFIQYVYIHIYIYTYIYTHTYIYIYNISSKCRLSNDEVSTHQIQKFDKEY